MGVSFRYWDDCVEPQDMQAMWMDPDVTAEWIQAGETVGSKVHLSCDTDGQPYFTQTEMKAVAGIIVRRHFISHIDSDMLCAIVQLESDQYPLTTCYNKKRKGTVYGLMQILPKTAEWLISELGYNEYDVHGDSDLLYKPFINLYLGAAYLKWLSNYGNKERSEEFMVRAYHGGVKKATHKSTLTYWKQYLSVKESLPSRLESVERDFHIFEVRCLAFISNTRTYTNTLSKVGVHGGRYVCSKSGQLFYMLPNASAFGDASSNTNVPINMTWELKASPEDMDYMWNVPAVNKEWRKSREKRGKVRISHDSDKRPYLSRVELKGVAEIVVSKYFSTKGVKPTVLCALAEIISKRFMNGLGQRTGLLGIDFPTACWIYRDMGYTAYNVESSDDLTKPFVSMYFGAAYLSWLSEYEGRERSTMFVVQAYILGPNNLKLEERNSILLKFEEALSCYETPKKEQGSCCILWH